MFVPAAPHLATRTVLSELPDTWKAAHALRSELEAGSRIRPDLLVVFGSTHHRALFSDALRMLRAAIHPVHLLACTTESVIVNDREIDQGPALAAMALNLPGVVMKPFTFGLSDGPPSVWSDGFIRERVALPPDHGALPHRGILMFADPFSINAAQACAAIQRAAGRTGMRITGGVTSGASAVGLDVLAADRSIVHSGIVGLSIFGGVELDHRLAEECAPIGAPMVVTAIKGKEIVELSGIPALAAAAQLGDRLAPRARELLKHGLILGVASGESDERFELRDCALRTVTAVDHEADTFTVDEIVPVGSDVQFYIRDPVTAAENLDEVLQDHAECTNPAGALLFACHKRGPQFFDEPNRDARIVSKALNSAPLLGCQCSGVIGGTQGSATVRCYSASATLLREPHSTGAGA